MRLLIVNKKYKYLNNKPARPWAGMSLSAYHWPNSNPIHIMDIFPFMS